MSFAAIIFTFIAALFLFRLPRQKAPLPLIIGASYMTLGPSIDVGPFHFTVIRLLILVGVLRVISRGERMRGHWNRMDTLIVLWAVWVVFSTVFHAKFTETLIFRLGLAYNALGVYFLLRIFIQDVEDVEGICKTTILVLVPIAIAMLFEAATTRNLFAFLGGVPDNCEIRGGKARAQGPFAHSILAGTVGAVSLPMAWAFWKSNRKLSLIGLAATGAITISSRSSGPVMTAFFSMCAIGIWKFRSYTRAIRWAGVLGVILLSLAMDAPVYYVLDRINITGHSTGWHRAYLIESTIKHFGDWWLGGTDYTRDWTPESGFDENNTDITNHYIRMAVWGGLALMLLFMASIAAGFKMVGQVRRLLTDDDPNGRKFLIWTLGCILVGHTATMVSVSYFDQSVVFFYLVLAAISSCYSAVVEDVRLHSLEPQPEVNPAGAEPSASYG